MHGPDGFEEGFGRGHAFLGSAKIRAVRAGLVDQKRLLRRSAFDGVVKSEPIVRTHADVDVDPQRRAGHADGIGAIFEDVMDLLDRSIAHLLGVKGAIGQIEDRIDGVGIEDMIGSDARSVGCSRRLRISDLPAKIVRFQPEAEQLSLFQILIAERRNDIFPARMFGIGGRIKRT